MNFKPLRLVGLTGLAGSGKDTVRQILEQDHGFCGLAFAEPIRQMLRTLLTENDISDAWMDERALKEQPIDGLGVSYRHMAQTLGTEWGRQCLHQDFWLRIAHEFIQAQRRQGERQFVISDVRFMNEARWVLEAGGEIWRIDRPGIAAVRAHVSESEVDAITPTRVIDNSGTVEDLWRRVDELMGVSA